MILCSIHEGKELNKVTKNKGIPYHWIKDAESETGFSMCYGGDKPITKESVPQAQVKAPDPDKMTKEEWAQKDKTKNEISARMSVGKEFISQAMSPTQAAQEGHMLEWIHFYLTGEITDNLINEDAVAELIEEEDA